MASVANTRSAERVLAAEAERVMKTFGPQFNFQPLPPGSLNLTFK
jgi:hypothetical protein